MSQVPTSEVFEDARAFFDRTAYERPRLFFSLDRATENYRRIAAASPALKCHYAVKAAPIPALIRRLAAEDGWFDVASREKIELCRAAGVAAERLSFGNTIKTPEAIEAAWRAGVRKFSFDCLEEARKIARHAPGATAVCRVDLTSDLAKWSLGRKFGCEPTHAVELLAQAAPLGFDAVGLSFHLGSQLEDPRPWTIALKAIHRIAAEARAFGAPVRLLNFGGGFPAACASFDGRLEPLLTDLNALALDLFGEEMGGDDPVDLMCEPGRAVVADAGVIEARVVLRSDRPTDSGAEWLYLDVGVFNGLFEAFSEGIVYRFASDGSATPTAPFVLAGPTCDSVDTFFGGAPQSLPASLSSGSRLFVLDAGAYTHAYATVGFNGFPPLELVLR